MTTTIRFPLGTVIFENASLFRVPKKENVEVVTPDGKITNEKSSWFISHDPFSDNNPFDKVERAAPDHVAFWVHPGDGKERIVTVNHRSTSDILTRYQPVFDKPFPKKGIVFDRGHDYALFPSFVEAGKQPRICDPRNSLMIMLGILVIMTVAEPYLFPHR